MAFQYNYPAPPFGQNLGQLHELIEANTSLNPYGFAGLIQNGNNITCLFSAQLSAPDEATLSNLIATFVPDTNADPCGDKFADILINKTVSSLVYTTCGAFYFPGSSSGISISDIKLMSYLTAGTSYFVRVIDYTNNKIVVPETTFTNTTYQYNDLGTLQNLPRKKALMEIQVKASSGAKIFVDNASIF